MAAVTCSIDIRSCAELSQAIVSDSVALKLVSNIDYSGATLSRRASFRNGIFEGNGFEISNLVTVQPMFTEAGASVFRNIVFRNVTMDVTTNFNSLGVLLGRAILQSTIENCHMTDSSLVAGAGNSLVGFLAGQLESSTMANCSVSRSSLQCHGNRAGLLAGRADLSQLRDCFVKESLLSGELNNAGGLLGLLTGGAMERCHVYDTLVEGLEDVGGVVGFSSNSKIRGCVNHGFRSDAGKAIAKGANDVGGIAGQAQRNEMSECGVKRGAVLSSSEAGGVAGRFEQTATDVNSLYVSEEVSVRSQQPDSKVGGLFGFVKDCAFGLVKSYSRATLAGSGIVGDLFGDAVSSTLAFRQVYCASNITATGAQATMAAIVGRSQSPANYSDAFFVKTPAVNESHQQPLGFDTLEQLRANASASFDASVWRLEDLRLLIEGETSSRLQCVYQVANCQQCPLQAPAVDVSAVQVVCDVSKRPPSWKLSSAQVVISQQTVTISADNQLEIDGDLKLSNDSVIVFDKQNSQLAAELRVSGCVELLGSVTVQLSAEEVRDGDRVELVRQSCSNVTAVEAASVELEAVGQSCATVTQAGVEATTNSIAVLLRVDNSACQEQSASRDAVKWAIVGVVSGVVLAAVSAAALYVVLRVKRSNEFRARLELVARQADK